MNNEIAWLNPEAMANQLQTVARRIKPRKRMTTIKRAPYRRHIVDAAIEAGVVVRVITSARKRFEPVENTQDVVRDTAYEDVESRFDVKEFANQFEASVAEHEEFLTGFFAHIMGLNSAVQSVFDGVSSQDIGDVSFDHNLFNGVVRFKAIQMLSDHLGLDATELSNFLQTKVDNGKDLSQLRLLRSILQMQTP